MAQQMDATSNHYQRKSMLPCFPKAQAMQRHNTYIH
jgi:hypothetical protein